MKTTAIFSLAILLLSLAGHNCFCQNVGIGTTSPPADLTVEGNGSSPAIPGGTSNGVFRIGVTFAEAIDFGKMTANPYAAWMQAGFNGTVTDPISLQPLGGNVGVGTLDPSARLHVMETGSGKGVLFTGEHQATPGNPPASGAGTRLMWYPDKAAFRAGRVSGTHWDKDSIGNYSAALGYNCKATGGYSFASGAATKASGWYSTAMGYYCNATADDAFAAGHSTEASAQASVALGNASTASGFCSGAFGFWVTAPGYCETVLGRYNVSYEPSSPTGAGTDRLFSLGNGSSVSASNALTVLNNGCMGLKSVTSPTYALELPNNSSYPNGSGRAYAWVTYSDERIKSDIRLLEDGLFKVMMLSPVSYVHHNSEVRNKHLIIETDGVPAIGFIAQEVYPVVPEVVIRPGNEATDLWSISYDKLVPLLTRAIQEQQAMIEDLQQKVEELEQKLTDGQ